MQRQHIQSQLTLSLHSFLFTRNSLIIFQFFFLRKRKNKLKGTPYRDSICEFAQVHTLGNDEAFCVTCIKCGHHAVIRCLRCVMRTTHLTSFCSSSSGIYMLASSQRSNVVVDAPFLKYLSEISETTYECR